VQCYASLGNHDSREQARYAPFNMGGRTYYGFKAPKQDVKLIAVAKGFDTDRAFLAVEIDGDQLFFNAISRTGMLVDAGVIERRRRGGAF
jgi:hypothetical protein